MPAAGERSGQAVADASTLAPAETVLFIQAGPLSFTEAIAIALHQVVAVTFTEAIALHPIVAITFTEAIAEAVTFAQAIADSKAFPDTQTDSSAEAGRGTGQRRG